MINISNMFQDDTIQTKTFTLASESEVYHTEIDNALVKQVLPQIETAIAEGKRYINVRHLGLVYHGRYWDDSILEISWD